MHLLKTYFQKKPSPKAAALQAQSPKVLTTTVEDGNPHRASAIERLPVELLDIIVDNFESTSLEHPDEVYVYRIFNILISVCIY